MSTRRTVLALTLGGLVLSLISTTSASADDVSSADRPARHSVRVGTLVTSPATYVGGQAITYTGSLGVAGVRRFILQYHMNRPGDAWTDVRGFSGKTAADGTFSFVFRAPAMFGLRYRVKAGSLKTAAVTFNAKVQDITMWVAGPNPASEWDPGQPVAGVPFTIAVDTTPEGLRPESNGLPIFAGRGLTLQRRIDTHAWETVGTSEVGADGMGYFPGVVAAAPGTVVYRTIAHDFLSAGNNIGWIQTFPTYVEVLATAPAPEAREAAPSPRVRKATARDGLGAASATASSKYGWYPALWDYTWEAGQSLTSPPEIGTVRTGWWQDYADGAGRVSVLNGGLYLDSQRHSAGPGDFGTTRATLMGTSQTYGRWEARLRLRNTESSAADFKVLVELVPAESADYACGKRNITLAQVAPHSSTMTFGAKADTAQWSRTKRIPSLINSAPAVAVEVAKGHITWFWDGKPIGTVKGKAAVSDVPMTLRFSIVGDQGTEYNQVGVHSDWQRSFALGRGKQVTSGPRMKKAALATCES